MIPAVRTGDIGIGTCSHGLDCCPHTYTNTMLTNNTRAYANSSARNLCHVTSMGVTTCPHCGAPGVIITGSSTVKLQNSGLGVARIGDIWITPCGSGVMVTGSDNIKLT